MTFAMPAAPLLPSCARLAAVCAAIEGKEVTCPVAMQRACPTLAAIRRLAVPAERRQDA